MNQVPIAERAQALKQKAIDGQWATRGAIARRLGKSRLNPDEVAALEYLAAQGQAEAREVETRAPSGRRWEYRLKE